MTRIRNSRKTANMEPLKIFDEKFHGIIHGGVKSVLLENDEESEEVEDCVSSSKEVENIIWKQNSLTCSYCRAKFEDINEQREHYKLDWHRYNLKQSLLSKQPITEEEFGEKTNKDDVSSISGSDSDKEDSLDTFATAQGKIFLQNSSGQVFSIYACLLYNKKEDLNEDQTILNRLTQCTMTNKTWTVLMLGGGHFAGAIFNGDAPVLHKTFHCYTVRAGQGGTQSSRDNKSGGSHPKSAGASLRRYNEQSLVQHVRNILESWKKWLDESSLIIYRASGPHNRSVLFPLLNKNDKRLRTIPFSTRRATFTEVQRVHSILTHAQIYESLQSAADSFSRHNLPTKRNKNRVAINRARSRETVERPLPVTKIQESSSDDDGDEEVFNLSSEMQDISFQDLREFEDSLTDKQRSSRKVKKPKKSKNKKLKEREELRKKDLIETLIRGDLDKLKTVTLDKDLVDEILDDEGNSLLHIAAMNEQTQVLNFLLEKEANPCLKNKKQQTAYTSTQSKEIRESLKIFAKENPDKFNYNKAQIPTLFLNPDEAEKKKVQRKIKREKEKVKKKENEVKKQENSERERFLNLSDREKRALAAERRILSQSGSVLARCFLCASDISGKVPFEYLGNRFCTIECLKGHRMQNPLVLS